MTDNLASFDDQLSQRFIALDPSGYFLISVDLEAQELVAEHYSNNLDDQGRATDPETGEVLNCDDVSPRKPSVVVRGRTAKEIGIALTEGRFAGLVSRHDHALYLGREFQKAEYCMLHRKKYIQD